MDATRTGVFQGVSVADPDSSIHRLSTPKLFAERAASTQRSELITQRGAAITQRGEPIR
jgi:hypothetical protein